jgi:hypothetical protein
MTVQPPCFPKNDQRTKDLREGLHIVFAKVRRRLEVGMSCPGEPEPLDLPMRGLLQAAGRGAQRTLYAIACTRWLCRV